MLHANINSNDQKIYQYYIDSSLLYGKQISLTQQFTEKRMQLVYSDIYHTYIPAFSGPVWLSILVWPSLKLPSWEYQGLEEQHWLL